MKTMHQADKDCFGCEMFIKSLRYIMALKEGRLEIGPCGQKLPGMGSNFNSSHCSYFLFLWNILFTCFYSHIQELHCLPTCKFCPWKIKPRGFNVVEPPVNLEVKSSSDLLGMAALDVPCLTSRHAWLGVSVTSQAWEIQGESAIPGYTVKLKLFGGLRGEEMDIIW